MKTISSQLHEAFAAAIRSAFQIDADPLIGPAQNEKFGDYQSNAAMGLAKQLEKQTGQKTNPRQVAEQIKARLDLGALASDITIAGPGFINVRLSPQWMGEQLARLRADGRLEVDKTASPQRVVIDYSGPNIAKQLHIGHFRSTNIGDALARLLEFHGDQVIRQNHVGDWGTQFGMLLSFLEETSAAGQPIDIPDLDAFYRKARQRFDADPQFAERARQTVVRLQSGQPHELALWQMIIEQSRRHFQPLYDRMNITLSAADERGESFYNPMLADVVAELRAKGVAVESEGAIVVWVEKFDAPLIIQKSGGGFGYATTDLAALRYRAGELRADRIIYITDARQSQHFAQVFATAARAGWTKNVQVEHVTFGTVLGADGKPFKSREGDAVVLKDVLDQAEERALRVVMEKNPLPEAQQRQIAHAVGIGAVKYFDLNKDRSGDYVFDWDKMLAMDGNTAPYLQYAYARVQSIARKAAERGVSAGNDIHLQAPQEIALARQILRLGEIIEQVARELRPHHLTSYLYDLATRFSSFFENCPVLQSEESVRSSRLALCEVTARTLALGLDLLGIEHPGQM